MAVDSPPSTPSTGEQEWFSEAEVPSSRRTSTKWSELRAQVKDAPTDPQTGKRKFKRVAQNVMNSATITRMFSQGQAGPGFEVRTRRVGKTQHTITKKGAKNEGQTVPRDTFDVYVRYDENFVPKPRVAKSSDGKAARK